MKIKIRKFSVILLIILVVNLLNSFSVGAATISNKQLKRYLNQMTLDEKLGQLYLVPSNGDADALNQAIKKYHLGGIVLFGNDFIDNSREQFIAKLQQMQSSSTLPLFIATDQEGGSVSRLSNNPALTNNRKFPSPREIYQSQGLSGLLQENVTVAKILKGLGINWNFAPVADVTDDSQSFMYDRTVGLDYQQTAKYIAKTVKQTQKQNEITTLKHFPGYGSCQDTHTGFAQNTKSLKQLKQEDLIPFKAGIKANVDSIMITHLVVNALDAQKPASLSKKVHTYLRKKLKYNNVIVTDDLGMGAIKDFIKQTNQNADVAAFMAGNDVLISADYQNGIPALKQAIKEKKITQKQLNQAVYRILKLKVKRKILVTLPS